MRKLLIGLALSVMATAAQAQWVLVAEGKDGDKFYADPTTKRRTGNVVRIWQVSDFLKPSALNGKLIYSQRLYRQYDCVERTSQILQVNSFLGQMASGESLGADNTPDRKIFVPPRSIGEAMLDFVCN
jgi:hypothetical protein